MSLPDGLQQQQQQQQQQDDHQDNGVSQDGSQGEPPGDAATTRSVQADPSDVASDPRKTEVMVSSTAQSRGMEQSVCDRGLKEGEEDEDSTGLTGSVGKEGPQAPDGGYGWWVVLGCFLSHTLLGGLDRTEGIFILQFSERFQSSSQVAAWPGALVSATRLLMGPVAGAVCNRYSVRTSVMIGTVIFVITLILDGFAPEVYFLFFSHGVVQGIGRGLMYTPAVVIVQMYFDRRRSLAAGLGSSGVGIGTFLLVPLIQYLFDNYGYKGTFLILGGMACHGFLFALLYRPLRLHHWFMQAKIRPTSRLYRLDTSQVKEEGTLMERVTISNKRNEVADRSLQRSEPDIQSSPPLTSNTTISQTKHRASGTKSCLKSTINILFPVENIKREHEKTPLFHFYLLREPPFLIYCISMVLFNIAFKGAFAFLPALALSKGLSEPEAALIMSIAGAFDTAGRIGIGFFLDIRTIRPCRFWIYNVAIFAIASISFVFPSQRTFWSLAIISALYGTLTGAYVSQKSVILVDILDKKHIASSFGLLICFQGLGTCIGPPLSGALKDTFGGFSEAMYLGGACMTVASGLMVLSNMLLRIQNKKQRQKNKDSSIDYL